MKNKVIYQDSDSIVVAKIDDIFTAPTEKELADFWGINHFDYEKWRKDAVVGKSVSASKTPHECPAEHSEHLPNGYNGIWIDEMTPPVVKSCEHEPVNVGFARCKMVCKKCDKELTE